MGFSVSRASSVSACPVARASTETPVRLTRAAAIKTRVRADRLLREGSLIVLLLTEQRTEWSLMISCARATRSLRRPSLDARSRRSIRPHPSETMREHLYRSTRALGERPGHPFKWTRDWGDVRRRGLSSLQSSEKMVTHDRDSTRPVGLRMGTGIAAARGASPLVFRLSSALVKGVAEFALRCAHRAL